MSGVAWGPTWRFKVGDYEFARYRREHRTDGRLWEANRHGTGSSGYRSPVTAFFGLRRAMKMPVRPL